MSLIRPYDFSFSPFIYTCSGLRAVVSAFLSASKSSNLGAVVSNQRALALYRRLGFQDSHLLTFRGERNEEDVVILRLTW